MKLPDTGISRAIPSRQPLNYCVDIARFPEFANGLSFLRVLEPCAARGVYMWRKRGGSHIEFYPK